MHVLQFWANWVWKVSIQVLLKYLDRTKKYPDRIIRTKRYGPFWITSIPLKWTIYI